MGRKRIEDIIKFYQVVILLSKEVLKKQACSEEDKVRTIDTYTDIMADCKVKIRELEHKLIDKYGVEVRNNADSKYEHHTRQF